MKPFLFAIIMLPLLLHGQYAVFTTDTMHLQGDEQGSEWIISGQRLSYGGQPVKVKVDDVLDTIFYRQDRHRPYDTIICQINKAETFYFVYNECCGGFYIADSNKQFFSPQLIFSMTKADNKHLYLGKLGDDGTLIQTGNSSSDTLKIRCHSPLLPNVFCLSFQKIAISQDTTLVLENACLEINHDINYDFTYKSLNNYCEFLYMPLSHACLRIEIDTRKKVFKLK